MGEEGRQRRNGRNTMDTRRSVMEYGIGAATYRAHKDGLSVNNNNRRSEKESAGGTSGIYR